MVDVDVVIVVVIIVIVQVIMVFYGTYQHFPKSTVVTLITFSISVFAQNSCLFCNWKPTIFNCKCLRECG